MELNFTQLSSLVDTFTELKSKYPGCTILFSTNAPFNYRELEKLGVSLGILCRHQGRQQIHQIPLPR